jgi:hypothetical protein
VQRELRVGEEGAPIPGPAPGDDGQHEPAGRQTGCLQDGAGHSLVEKLVRSVNVRCVIAQLGMVLRS